MQVFEDNSCEVRDNGVFAGGGLAGRTFYMASPFYSRNRKDFPAKSKLFGSGFFDIGINYKLPMTERTIKRASKVPANSLGYLRDNSVDAIWRRMRWSVGPRANVTVTFACQEDDAKKPTCKFFVRPDVRAGDELFLGTGTPSPPCNLENSHSELVVTDSGVHAAVDLPRDFTFHMINPVHYRVEDLVEEFPFKRGIFLLGDGTFSEHYPSLSVKPLINCSHFIYENSDSAMWLCVQRVDVPENSNVRIKLAGSYEHPHISFALMCPIRAGEELLFSTSLFDGNEITWPSGRCPVVFGPRGCIATIRPIIPDEYPSLTAGELILISEDDFLAIPEVERFHKVFQFMEDNALAQRGTTLISGYRPYIPASLVDDDRPLWYCVPIAPEDDVATFVPHRVDNSLVFYVHDSRGRDRPARSTIYRSRDEVTHAVIWPEDGTRCPERVPVPKASFATQMSPGTSVDFMRVLMAAVSKPGSDEIFSEGSFSDDEETGEFMHDLVNTPVSADEEVLYSSTENHFGSNNDDMSTDRVPEVQVQPVAELSPKPQAVIGMLVQFAKRNSDNGRQTAMFFWTAMEGTYRTQIGGTIMCSVESLMKVLFEIDYTRTEALCRAQDVVARLRGGAETLPLPVCYEDDVLLVPCSDAIRLMHMVPELLHGGQLQMILCILSVWGFALGDQNTLGFYNAWLS